MKKLILLLVLFFSICGIMYAAQSDTFNITVNITGLNKSVSIVEDSTQTYTEIGQTITYSSITVTNDSGGYEEDYQVMASTVNDRWTLSIDDNAGTNKAVLYAIFRASGQDASGATFGTEDIVTFGYKNCSTTAYANDGDADTGKGYNVENNGIRSLLLRLKAPTSVTVSNPEQITVTINAN